MTKIVEILPNDLPEWAIEAMDKGQLFSTMLAKIKYLEKQIKKYNQCMQTDASQKAAQRS